jgi:sialic acid synthase SpsE
VSIEIRGIPVGATAPVFVIAELGLNHGGDVARALELVDAAAAAGASAVKLQTLAADRLVAADCPPPAHVSQSSVRELLRPLELDGAAHHAVAERAHHHGLAFLSTPLDERLVDLLEDTGCDAYKIASGDLTHLRLIETAARTGKPLLLSTGMSTLSEIRQAVERARDAGARALALLHCVSAYPVPPGHENLRAISTLARELGLPVGLSDHGTDPVALPVAIGLGAVLYEKHVRLDTAEEVIDQAVSVTPAELAELIEVARRAHGTLGHGDKRCLEVERANLIASRRGLCAARDIPAGDRLTDEALVALRPAVGIDAARWHTVVNRRVSRAIASGSAIRERDLIDETVGGHRDRA